MTQVAKYNSIYGAHCAFLRRGVKNNFNYTLNQTLPEGMAVGIVFASCLSGNYGVQIMSAMALSIGIAIQNFPEGMAISLPYKAEGTSNKKAFLIGTLSRNCGAYSSCYNYFIK